MHMPLQTYREENRETVIITYTHREKKPSSSFTGNVGIQRKWQPSPFFSSPYNPGRQRQEVAGKESVPSFCHVFRPLSCISEVYGQNFPSLSSFLLPTSCLPGTLLPSSCQPPYTVSEPRPLHTYAFFFTLKRHHQWRATDSPGAAARQAACRYLATAASRRPPSEIPPAQLARRGRHPMFVAAAAEGVSAILRSAAGTTNARFRTGNLGSSGVFH